MKKDENNQIIEGIHYETLKPVRIEIANGLIKRIDKIAGLDILEKQLFVAPGLIDNQINGYAGIDFSGDNLTAEGIVLATEAIWRDGVTSYMPTILTNSHENLIRNFKIFDKAINTEICLQESIFGIHLEGPYISPEEGFRGCHPLKYIRKPSWKEFMTYQEASGGRIKQVTLAPEVEGAMEFIRKCAENGIVVAIGHTNATSMQIAKAVDAGARISTHLGNGCANLIHRHNNPIWPQLSNEMLTATLIADGLHLTPEEINVFYKVKGQDNIILTSDIVYLGGMSPGRYSFLESEVVLTKEGMLINSDSNVLAGASFPLKKGFGNIMNFTKCALDSAVKMASRNASRTYKLSGRGALEPGKRGDIILFKMIGGEVSFDRIYLKGKLVFQGE